MKTLLNTKYFELSAVKAIAIGIGYNDECLSIIFPFLLLEIKVWRMIKAKKVQTF